MGIGSSIIPLNPKFPLFSLKQSLGQISHHTCLSLLGNLTKDQTEAGRLTSASGNTGHIYLSFALFLPDSFLITFNTLRKKTSRKDANVKNAGKVIIVALEIPREAG